MVYKRNGLIEFLEFVASHFEVVLWTAATNEYADAVVDDLDPEKRIFSHRLYRENCEATGKGNYTKNL